MLRANRDIRNGSAGTESRDAPDRGYYLIGGDETHALELTRRVLVARAPPAIAGSFSAGLGVAASGEPA